jgi:hypothetical protein
MVAEHGSLIHADRHGAVVIPLEIAPLLPAVFLDVYSPATTAILGIFATARPVRAGESSGAGPKG